jgi:hypothetical protein
VIGWLVVSIIVVRLNLLTESSLDWLMVHVENSIEVWLPSIRWLGEYCHVNTPVGKDLVGLVVY